MRGSKDYNKVTHSLDGKSADKKKKALHAMVEALVSEKSEDAATYLHSYLKMKTREILVGESEDGDEEKKDEKSDDKKDDEDKSDDSDKKDDKDEDKLEKSDDKDDENKKDDKKVDESFGTHNHPEGAMSRKIHGNIKFASGKKTKTLDKHGNAAPELDDNIKGEIKFANGGKKTLDKHGNAAPGLDGSIKGNFLKK